MKSGQLIVSAIAVLLLATPSFAQKPDAKHSQMTSYVVVDGTVVGADPDARIRGAMEREWLSLHGE